MRNIFSQNENFIVFDINVQKCFSRLIKQRTIGVCDRCKETIWLGSRVREYTRKRNRKIKIECNLRKEKMQKGEK